MPIERIKYERLFSVGQYENELFSYEGTLGERETKEQLQDEMHQAAVSQNRRNNPHLYVNETHPVFGPITQAPAEPPPIQVERETSSVEEQINEITDIKVLESFKLLVKNNKAWQECYDKKMEELTNGF